MVEVIHPKSGNTPDNIGGRNVTFFASMVILMQPAPLVRKVGQFLHGLEAGCMVVAVSGGPDSVALLRALAALGPSITGPLVVAHLNHQLRGADSDADEAFVRELYTILIG